MVSKQDFLHIEPLLYEIPRNHRPGMRVPARIYADDALLEEALEDRAVEQLLNTTFLPGVVGRALAMPDFHQGYGFPIGGVAATVLPDGVISPGGVGYDINCGVRLLSTSLASEEVRPRVPELMDALYNGVPTGVGTKGDLRLSSKEMRAVLERGASWAVGRGFGRREDLLHSEDQGCIPGADADALSERARERGATQVGTLGAGNHFLEVDEIVQVLDDEAASAFGLVQGTVCVWIHCGSRGLGHQVCTDAVRQMQGSPGKYGIEIPDRELVCAPFVSDEGKTYFQAMSCAANYAWANRQVITHNVRRAFEEVLGGRLSERDLGVVYDVCHNIAKVEAHEVDGSVVELCVHRKGATRAFGPNRPEVPQDYRRVGQPVLIPGNMAAGSYVLVGTDKAMRDTFGSTCHGAGRTMSRSRARKMVHGQGLRAQLEGDDISVRAGSMRGLAEEAPHAYKDLERVVDVVHRSGIARKVARTRPLGVIKG